jgi:transcriptional regulator with XRE-family HTH domain
MAEKTGKHPSKRLPMGSSAPARTTPFGNAIAVRLERLGYTLEAGAKRCGVPVPTLSSYKDGRILGRGTQARPTVIKIALGLGIPVEDALEMVGLPRGQADEQTALGLYRRLSRQDKVLAVEILRTLVNVIRARN